MVTDPHMWSVVMPQRQCDLCYHPVQTYSKSVFALGQTKAEVTVNVQFHRSSFCFTTHPRS